ncbi:MAG: nucleotide-binding protein [Candidatus Nitrosocosmicus sp.]|nr:nucleotide-binding protein [Candidatus Nitrosocosmicus sp.]
MEKFEEYSDCKYAFILMTPDDKLYQRKKSGSKNERNYDYHSVTRARQNVIFEYGYFVAKLTREKVVVIYKEGVEISSDIKGVEYVSIKKSVEEIYLHLREKLDKAGLIT